MNGSETAMAAGILGGFFAMAGFLAFVFVVLMIIARWRIFTKADEAGWKSLIPIYADYIQWRIAWTNMTLFWVMLGCAIGGSILMSLGGYMNMGTAGAAVNMPLVGIGFVAEIAAIV